MPKPASEPPTAFRLSRIYAQGWNAARTSSLKPSEPVVNPYPAEPERSRWNEGFAGARDKT
jgi:hypothetical protein